MRRVLLLCVFAAACVDNPSEPTLDVDFEGYEQQVHPYVEVACGTLDCHGDEGRPLRLYGEFGLRLEDRDSPISAFEYEENAYSLRGVGDDSLILLKPLSEAAGGLHHVGGDVWPDEQDPGYRCLHGWLVGDAEMIEACPLAAAAVAVPAED